VVTNDVEGRSDEPFFISGGTVPLESPSYVKRAADDALFEALTAGKFCYVLNSRQMGKSSLCVRTMARLESAGTRTAFVDLTKIGGRNVTPEQWYAGLVVEVGRALGLRSEMLRAWQGDRDLSPMQRFFSALRDIALEKIVGPIAIFVDEIDSTRSLSFSANEFFAGIRECYNRRVHDAAYKRLTFCLLGVAVPGDLMADVTTTPFNIGERIVLGDFTEAEATSLAAGLAPGLEDHGKEALHKILFWTSGHPFLTQSLAGTLASRNRNGNHDVDGLVAEMLFQAKARETNINLADVGNRILNGYTDPDQISKYRADILSMYDSILRGREVIDDESNRLAAVLKLSGIVRVEDRRLKVRNRIYERVFDRAWVRENMPGAEIRRQRRAFIRGALRTASVAAVVLAIIAALAWKAMTERDRANYEVYVATMNLMRPTWEQNNVERMREMLERVKDNPARGWEWDYWYRMTHLETKLVPMPLVKTLITRFAANGRMYFTEKGRVSEYDPASGEFVDLLPSLGGAGEVVFLFPDGMRLLEYDGDRTGQIINIANRKPVMKLEDFNCAPLSQIISPDGRWALGTRASEWNGTSFHSAVLFDTQTGKPTVLPTPRVHVFLATSPDGKMIATEDVDPSQAGTVFHPVVREFGTWKVLHSFQTAGSGLGVGFSPDSSRLVAGTVDGWLHVFDLKTGRELDRERPTGQPVIGIEFSQDGKWLAVSANDRIGRLYDATGPQLKLLKTFRDSYWLSISPDKKRVSAQFSSVRLYDPERYNEEIVADAKLKSSDQTTVLSAQGLARVRAGDKVYEVDPLHGESRPVSWLQQHPEAMADPGMTWGVVAGHDGAARVLDFDTRKTVFSLPAGTKEPQMFAQFPDRRRALMLYADKRAEVWDASTGKLTKAWELAHWPTAVAFSADGRTLAIGYYYNAVSLWDTTTWTERNLDCECIGVNSLTFSKDGKTLIFGGVPMTGVFNLGSGQLAGKLTGHTQPVEDVSFSPDGRRILTASDDSTLRIWDAATFRELTMLAGHRINASRARFSPDGKSIISVDILGSARMWLTDTPSGDAK
jgi:WD40 repeat protein